MPELPHRPVIVRRCRDQVERRWNWMAAQAMLNGTITLSGDEYPTTTVDFGRAAGHTITLASGSRWGDAGIMALDNLETWSTTVFNAVGYPVDVVIMGTTAWTAFRKDTDLRALNLLQQGADRLGGLDIVPGSGAPLQYKGSDGMRQFWVYSESYDTDETTSVAMMDPRDVLLVASAGIAGALIPEVDIVDVAVREVERAVPGMVGVLAGGFLHREVAGERGAVGGENGVAVGTGRAVAVDVVGKMFAADLDADAVGERGEFDLGLGSGERSDETK